METRIKDLPTGAFDATVGVVANFDGALLFGAYYLALMPIEVSNPLHIPDEILILAHMMWRRVKRHVHFEVCRGV